MLCYGHVNMSSNLIHVLSLYSSMVEHITVNNCIDVRFILRANKKQNENFYLKLG